MAKTINLPLADGATLEAITKAAEQQLQAQGFEVTTTVMGTASSVINVKKDRDGIKNIIGLGIECQATLTVMGNNMVTVNIESEWGNKILALALGWILCWVPFITGIVGCVNQSGLPNKVTASLQAAAASANS